MAKFLPFFPRQTLVSSGAAVTTYLSDVYDVSDCSSVQHELKIYGASGLGAANVTGLIEQTDDPTFASPSADTFTAYGTSILKSGTPTDGVPLESTGVITSVPKRFVRGKVIMPASSYAVISYIARGFC